MKKHLFLTSLLAIVATTGAAKAEITMTDVKNSMDMSVSDGSYTIGETNYNVNTDDYSTSDYYGLYTYDHDGNESTDEIALTSNNKSETLDLNVFTYTDNNGAETNLSENASGFTADQFKVAAGTVDAAHGTTDLTELEVDGTVGVSNYKYLADFTDSGTETLTTLTAEEPSLDMFTKTIDLVNGEQLVVTGNSVENKPNETQYGFEIAMDNGETGVFGIEWNASAQQYNYIYKGHKEGSDIVADDYVLTETDKDNAKNAVATAKGNLLTDIAEFDAAIIANQANFDSAKGHYDAVHAVYEADAGNQDSVNTNWTNYETSFGAANTAKGIAQTSLENAQNSYADDLITYNDAKKSYDDYEASLGKVVDTRAKTVADEGDAATLASAKDYADGLGSNYDAAGAAATAETNAKDYADGLASNYDAAGAAATAETNANAYADAGDAATLASAKDYADAGDAATLASAKDYADAGDAATLASAKTYADAGDAATLASAKTYADAGDAATLASAKDYADEGDAATLASAKDYADEGDAATLASAKTYADAGDAATLASAKDYADAGDAATLASAKDYADEGDALTLQSAKAFAAEQSALTLSQANAYTDKKVDTLEKNLSGGVAAATALSAVNVSNVSKGEVSVGAGYGYYNSQSAAAFGAAMGLSDRWSVNAGAGIAQGDKTQFSIRAGTNYKFKLF